MNRTFLLPGLVLAACLWGPGALQAADGDAAKPDPAKQFSYGFESGINAMNFVAEPEERFLERFAARDDWESVSIRVDGFSDRILERIAQCPTIREFGLIELTGRGGRTVVNRLTDRGMAKLAALPNLKSARFNSNHVGGATVRAMAGSPTLEVLSLSGSRITENPVTDDDLAALGQSRSLRALTVEYSHGEKPVFTVRGLEGLARCRTLERLMLFLIYDINAEGRNDFDGDQVLAALTPLTNLKELSLPCISLGDKQAVRIAKTWPALEELTIGGPALGDEGLSALAGLASLKRLWLDGGDYTDKGIVALRRNRALRELSVSRLPEAVTLNGLKTLAGDSPITKLSLSLSETLANTDEGQRIPALFPRLESLSLFGSVDPVGIQALAGLNGLKNLRIFQADQLGDRELEALRECKSLTELMLLDVGSGITDKGLAALAAMPRLERITINGNSAGITPEGQAALRKAKPKAQPR